ncbi:MAG: DUF3365 domain-containing protein [Nitrospira sp.]|nr:DUF3365 domain-containing protein [Nitrospira sp.]
MKPNNLKLSTKFALAVSLILLVFCAIFSTILYHYLKTQVIRDAEDKTLIIMNQVEAIGDYVRDTLRPAIFESLARHDIRDEFIVEAMSTTYVSRHVMERFNRVLKEYVFKRVSDNPRNPKDRADSFHSEMLNYFRLNREQTTWRGIVDIEGKKYLFRISSVVITKDCLRCHGNPTDTPKELVRRYGTEGGFSWKVGDVSGLNSVSIPLDVAFAHVKDVAVHTFIFGFCTLGLLFLTLFGTFRHLVTRPLNNLSHIFRSIAKGTVPLGKDIPSKRGDEIGDLTESFNILSRHLLDAQVRLKKAAEREKQMMESEKLATLGQLSAGVAHEINNPLGGIRLCFNNLMKTEMDTNTKKHHIEVINSGLERIQNIVRQLLDFAKDSSLDIAPSSINNIIEDTLKLSEYIIVRKDIKLIKELSNNMPDLMVDSNKLEQVFLNLIINAIHAMDGGGVLTIRTWYDGDACNVSVTDTGKGIPNEVISRIFDPFFTTKGVGEGTGLGLTVSKAIVEQHKGKIEVKTSEKGSVFIVRIPITT